MYLRQCIRGGDLEKRDGFILSFRYDAGTVEKLKRAIPHTDREWNSETKNWWVSAEYAPPARKERKNTAIRLTRIAGQEWQDWKGGHPNETIGWKPTCTCGCDEAIPCTVLDPFAGASTTLLVAQKLNRKAIGYELSSDYCKLGKARLKNYMPLWELKC